MKKKSGLLKVLGAIVLLAAGVIIGKTFFSSNSPTAVPIPSTMKYRNVGQSKDTTQAANKDLFSGKIIAVKDGGSIQKAVAEAEPGDLIQVYPGKYHETVYIDKNNISFQGIIINGEWPTLDGNKKLNDAFLYSGDGISIENFKIENYKGNGIMGQAGNNFTIRNNWIIDTGVYGIFPQ